MDTRTGKIKEFATKEEAAVAGYTVPLKRAAKKNCKHCYGRGHCGMTDKGKFVACRCTQ